MKKAFKFFRDNKGITLVELIVVLALILIVIPFAWDYMNSSLEDSATINNKVAVQSSVNALMTQLQRDIQEASRPINSNDEDYIGSKELGADNEGRLETGTEGFLIRKPDRDGKKQSVLYEFYEDGKKVVVTSGLDFEDPTDTSESTVAEYNFIKDIKLKKVGENGVDVYIRGELDSKSGYTLTNVYYTRNTI